MLKFLDISNIILRFVTNQNTKTMTNAQAITNFMFFANNFGQTQLNAMFNVTSAPQHLKEKFQDLSQRNGGGTEGFFAWFMELSQNNKDVVCEYITNHYSWKL